MNIGPRSRKALKIAGYVLAALVTFVYGVHLAFPYDRLAEKAKEALKSKYDVDVKSVERGWLPGDFSLVKVQLITRPTKPNEAPKIIMIDRIDIDVGVLSMLTGEVDVDLDAKLGRGHIAGTVTVAKGRLKANVSSTNLPLSDVPGLSGVIGMPMGGNGNVRLALDLPNNDWRKANAKLGIDCPHCTIGGEGAYFKPRNANAKTAAYVDKGVEVPMMNIDSLSAEWTVQGGKIKTPKFVFTSPHLTVALDFEATVGATIGASTITNGCIRYRGSDALKELSEKFYNALELTGGPVGPDDQRHLKLVGSLGQFRAVAKICGLDAAGGDGSGGDVAGGTRARPDLGNVTTDKEATGGGPVVLPQAPPDAQPAAATGAPPDAQPTPKVDDVKPGPAPEVKVAPAPPDQGGPPQEPPPATEDQMRDQQGAAEADRGEPPPAEGQEPPPTQ